MRARNLWFVALLVALVISVIVIAGQADLKEVRGMRAHDRDTISVDFDGEEQDLRYVSINAPGFKTDVPPSQNEKVVPEQDLLMFCMYM